MGQVYTMVKSFMRRFPGTIAWRLKAHSRLIEKNLNPGEEVFYAFCAQKNDSAVDIISTCVVVLTNERIFIGQKRVLFGYHTYIITPNLFNDLQIKAGIVWGKVYIDTVKELVSLTNIAKSALPEIETKISEYVALQRRRFGMDNNCHRREEISK